MSSYLLGLATLSILTVLVLSARFLWRRHWRAQKVSAKFRLASLIVLHAGVLLVLVAVDPISQSLEKRHWSETFGVVTESEIVEPGYFRPQVQYVYRVDEREYRGQSDFAAPGFGSKSKRYQTAKAITDRHRAGDSVVVIYDPGDPARSALIRGASWSSWTQLALGAILFSTGFLVALLPRK
jgi:hypothetical protein